MRRSKPSSERRFGDERGSASLEFLTVGLILLVPLVYLVLAIASVQAGALAVEGAARHAARVAVLAADDSAARTAVDRAVRIALEDYGVDAGRASVEVTCDPASACTQPGARVRVDVDAAVVLPLVPDVFGLDRFGSVQVSASATQTVSRFAEGLR
ncbi:hypothetical protein ABIQ69_06535 [Agromyces sp. G08B096]|uniref:TadE family protein n=1 Tax=Agromyces sp. G08B096 TaxID=3156399 RepID=A0AAU7WDP5_9MICO